MRRHRSHFSDHKRPNSARQTPLGVEFLEDRSLLDAGLSSGVGQILVAYEDDPLAVHKVELEDGQSLEDALETYGTSAGVLYAEEDYEVHAALVPNDSSFGSLYGLHNIGQSGGKVDADIDAPEAWDITTGSLQTVVAVIDSGIDYRHRDLYLNIWINQGEIPVDIRSQLLDLDSDGMITFRDLNDSRNQGAGKITDLNGNGYIDGGDLLKLRSSGGWADGVSNDGDGYIDDLVGWDFYNNDNDPFDDNGHGTHVAGTIGATGNNGTGVVGVNWQVQMIGLKFLGASGSGSTSAAVSALNYAVAKGADLSNNSWGGGGYSTSLYNALNNARSAGHIFVAAAGNNGSNNDSAAHYPSSYNLSNVVAVAATDRNDLLASFSNYGSSSVDLAAPGVAIYSTTPNNSYAYYSGTSMATPHVAGALALLKSANPGLTYSQLISRLLNNVDQLASLSGKVGTGGRLNVFGAIGSEPSEPTEPAPAPPPSDTTGPTVTSASPNASGSSSVSSVRVTFSEEIDPNTFTAADVTNFLGPNGSVAVQGVQAVAGSGNRQFDIIFSTQTAAGTYRFDIGPDVRDLAGNMMNQDGDNTFGEATDDCYSGSFSVNSVSTYSAAPNAAIPDRGKVVSVITIDEDVTVGDLNLQINITHTYNKDLYIYLIGPDGTVAVLVNRRGGSGDNFTNTLLDDEATTAIAKGKAPFAGSFRPDQALSRFDGKNARGTWQLVVEDRASTDVGKLVSWSMTVAEGAGGPTRGRSVNEGDLSPGSENPRGRNARADQPADLILYLDESPVHRQDDGPAPAAVSTSPGAAYHTLLRVGSESISVGANRSSNPDLGESRAPRATARLADLTTELFTLEEESLF